MSCSRAASLRHQVRPTVAQPAFEADRLLQHGEAVLVDVLVAMVLVPLQSQCGKLGEHELGETRVDQQGEPPPGLVGEQQLGQLVADPLGGHDREPRRHAGHRRDHLRRDLHAELSREPRRAHHPQRVVGEGLLRSRRGAQDARRQVAGAAEQVDELLGGQPHRHRVDGEVAAYQVAVERRAERHGRLAGVRPVRLCAVGRDLQLPVTDLGADGAELPSDVPPGIHPAAREEPLDLRRWRGRREVEVVSEPAEERVADRTAYQRDLVTGGGEPGTDFTDQGRGPQQLADGGTADLGKALFRSRHDPPLYEAPGTTCANG